MRAPFSYGKMEKNSAGVLFAAFPVRRERAAEVTEANHFGRSLARAVR